MKPTTSDWFSTLTLRSMKDLACLLFDLSNRVQEKFPQHYELFIDLRNHLDNEYHDHKQPPESARQMLPQTSWDRIVTRGNY